MDPTKGAQGVPGHHSPIPSKTDKTEVNHSGRTFSKKVQPDVDASVLKNQQTTKSKGLKGWIIDKLGKKEVVKEEKLEVKIQSLIDRTESLIGDKVPPNALVYLKKELEKPEIFKSYEVLLDTVENLRKSAIENLKQGKISETTVPFVKAKDNFLGAVALENPDAEAYLASFVTNSFPGVFITRNLQIVTDALLLTVNSEEKALKDGNRGVLIRLINHTKTQMANVTKYPWLEQQLIRVNYEDRNQKEWWKTDWLPDSGFGKTLDDGNKIFVKGKCAVSIASIPNNKICRVTIPLDFSAFLNMKTVTPDQSQRVVSNLYNYLSDVANGRDPLKEKEKMKSELSFLNSSQFESFLLTARQFSEAVQLNLSKLRFAVEGNYPTGKEVADITSGFVEDAANQAIGATNEILGGQALTPTEMTLLTESLKNIELLKFYNDFIDSCKKARSENLKELKDNGKVNEENKHNLELKNKMTFFVENESKFFKEGQEESAFGFLALLNNLYISNVRKLEG